MFERLIVLPFHFFILAQKKVSTKLLLDKEICDGGNS